jgi:hypothetical protein
MDVRYQSTVFQDLSVTRLMVSDTLTGAIYSKQCFTLSHFKLVSGSR